MPPDANQNPPTDAASPKEPTVEQTVVQPDAPATPPEPATATPGTAFQDQGDAERARDLSTKGGDATEPFTAVDASAAEWQARRRAQEGAFEAAGYELIRLLGEGTYGVVWLARDKATGIEVAVKFLTRSLGERWQALQAEVKQLALMHADPGIVQLVDCAPDADPPYYVMRYAERGSLAARLKQGPMPVAEAVAIFRRVVEALAYVHAKGIRHCDLKPGNILLDSRERALVCDFGQSHLVSDSTPALGTFFYMAPEQANLAEQFPDSSWDVYGLGALLYAMLTGKPPRHTPELSRALEGTERLAHRLERYREGVRKAPPPRAHRKVPGMDRGLANLIDRCLEIDPGKRLRSAGSVLEQLQRRDWLVRHRKALIAAVIGPVLLLLLLASFGFWSGRGALNEARTALETQLGKSDHTAAKLVAFKVRERLTERMELVKEAAAENDLRRWVAERNGANLKAAVNRLSELRISNQKDDERLLFRWAVFDRTGVMLALSDGDQNLLGKSFAFRDYFNGQGDHSAEKGTPGVTFAPITRPHYSQPFKARGEEAPGILICLSVPVQAPEGKDVVGVLMASIKFDRLSYFVDEVSLGDGFAVLVNDHDQVLKHDVMSRVMPDADQKVRTYPCDLYHQTCAGKDGYEFDFRDPVDRRRYLVGYAPIDLGGGVRWAALVQHRRAAVEGPVSNLQFGMLIWGALMLTAAGLFLLGFWVWLAWVLRFKEGGSHA
jgi:hypothetical protein